MLVRYLGPLCAQRSASNISSRNSLITFLLFKRILHCVVNHGAFWGYVLLRLSRFKKEKMSEEKIEAFKFLFSLFNNRNSLRQTRKCYYLVFSSEKMPQSGVGSMQISNEDCLPIKGHTRGGDAPTVLPIERTHRGGDAPTM